LVEDCCGAFDVREHEAAVHNIAAYFGGVAESNTVLDILKNRCGMGVSDETA
jgi:nicotinamidase-related amidase